MKWRIKNYPAKEALKDMLYLLFLYSAFSFKHRTYFTTYLRNQATNSVEKKALNLNAECLRRWKGKCLPIKEVLDCIKTLKANKSTSTLHFADDFICKIF